MAPFLRTAVGLLLCSSQGFANGAGGTNGDDEEEVSRQAGEIVRGLTESFLGKDVSAQERYCLAGGAGKLAGGVMETSLSTVSSLNELFGKAKTVAHDFGMPIKAGPTKPPVWGAPYPTGLPGVWVEASPVLESSEAAITTVELARITAIKLGTTLTSLFGFEHQLVKSCITGDSKEAFETAKGNLANMSFVCGHLVANGVDIVSSLSEALTAFEAQKYRVFGAEIGTAWRKVLLSKRSTSSSDLTAKVKDMLTMLEPSKLVKDIEHNPEVIEKVSKGMVDSLFGSNFKVEIIADAPPVTTIRPLEAGWSPSQPGPNGVMRFTFPQAANAMFGATKEEEIAVDVDLHSCISGNMELMSASWEPVVELAEQFMEGHCTGSVRALCMSLWTVVLTDMQEGLRTCGFTPQQQKVLVHSLWAGKLFHANLSLPDEQVHTGDVTSTMAHAMTAYKEKDWTTFGENLGDLAREMLVVSFPQKWSIDENGRLREQLQEEISNPTFGIVLAVPTMLLLTAAAAVRGLRSGLYGPHRPEVLQQLDLDETERGSIE